MLDEHANAVDFYKALRTKVPDWPDPHIPAELIRFHVFGASPSNARAEARLQAINAICVNDNWASDWLVFVSVVLSLNGVEVDIEMLPPPLVGHIARAMKDIRAVTGSCGKLMPDVSDEVVEVIQAACRDEGLLRYPESLREYEPARSIEERANIELIDRTVSLAQERTDIDWNVFPADVVAHNVVKLVDIESYCVGGTK